MSEITIHGPLERTSEVTHEIKHEYRVLRSGDEIGTIIGEFVIGHDGKPSSEMLYYRKGDDSNSRIYWTKKADIANYIDQRRRRIEDDAGTLFTSLVVSGENRLVYRIGIKNPRSQLFATEERAISFAKTGTLEEVLPSDDSNSETIHE